MAYDNALAAVIEESVRIVAEGFVQQTLPESVVPQVDNLGFFSSFSSTICTDQNLRQALFIAMQMQQLFQ